MEIRIVNLVGVPHTLFLSFSLYIKTLLEQQSMRYSRFLPFALALFLVFLFLQPVLLWVLLSINLLLLFLHGLMQLHIAYRPKTSTLSAQQSPSKQLPLVSIHLPTYSEPPHLVCATIDSILQQGYSNFELIVLDNNTSDPALWEPVQTYCEGLTKVQFLHLENVEGYKAGALNICREYTHKTATYIFTVDADYVLTRDCLEKAVTAAQESNVALVQFPQAYSNVSAQNEGLAAEYRHYFALYASHSNLSKAMLGTGTLSLLRINALDDIGGWPTKTITEDAELGVALQAAGFETLFVDEELGYGKMPAEIAGLRQQRLRWIFGNFQTLLSYLMLPRLWRRSAFACLAQLTAWINFCGVAFLLLLGECMRFLLVENATLHVHLVEFCLITIGLHLFFKWGLFWRSSHCNMLETCQLFLTHLSYTEEAAFGWWDALIGLNKPFVRTNKFAQKSSWTDLPIGLPILLAWCSGVLAYSEHWVLSHFVLSGAILWLVAITRLFRQVVKTNLLDLEQQEHLSLRAYADFYRELNHD